MDFASVVVKAAPDMKATQKSSAAENPDEPQLSEAVAAKAKVALGRTGIKGARQGKSKSGFLQKRGPLKVSTDDAVSVFSRSLPVTAHVSARRSLDRELLTLLANCISCRYGKNDGSC